ncbi:MAG: DUF2142 domain-containing protein [Chloroflexi bacterium]|nr:DUF2142 domain-containing protein [Chloroflexota bacterium]
MSRSFNRVTALRAHAGFWLVLVAFLALGAAYGLAAPVFEKPDEPQHFFFVREIAEGRGLPVQVEGRVDRWQQEGSQPPLYYLLAAVLTAGFDASDWQSVSATNPYAVQGDPQTPGNRNVYLHSAADGFPGRGTVLAVYATRFVSLLFGAVGLLVTYLLARRVFPGRRGVATTAVAVQAFIPQFLFVSTAVSNDAFAALACGLVLFQAIRVVQGAARRRDDVLLGALVGIAALAKLSGAAMGLVAALAIILYERQRIAAIVQRGIVSGGTALLVAGWWYARNWLLYGDLTGLNRMLAIVGIRNPPPDLWQLLDETEGLRLSFWGLFGWFSILLPETLYLIYGALTVAVVGGLLILGLRRITSRDASRAVEANSLALVVATFGIVLVGVLRWGMLTPGLQGRLLFPALSALAVLMSGGLHAWLERPVGRWIVGGLLAGMVAMAAFVPGYVIAPAYALPDLLLASSERPIVRFGDRIDLIAVSPAVIAAQPGSELPIELRWQVREPLNRAYTLYIKVFGVDDELIAATDTYPGFGMFPTTQWPANRLIVDRYRLRIKPNATTPVAGKVVVGWYDRATGAALPPANADGQRVVRPVVARVNVIPISQPTVGPQNRVDAQFADLIALQGYDLSPGKVTFYWMALTPLEADYTVFVHALDSNGRIIDQRDTQPLGGWYPTSIWRPGNIIKDEHAFQWPPQTVNLAVGLYTSGGSPPLQVGSAGRNELVLPVSR